MTKQQTAITAALIFGFSSPAHADLADELVELAAVREDLSVAVMSCREFAKDLIGEQYKLNYQADELGLAPDDPAWFKLAAIYREFYDDACSYVDVEELATVFADMFRERFSDSELAEIVAFHKTATGSKYVSVTSEIAVNLNEIVNQRMAEGAVAAQSKFEASIQQFWLEQGLKPEEERKAESL